MPGAPRNVAVPLTVNHLVEVLLCLDTPVLDAVARSTPPYIPCDPPLSSHHSYAEWNSRRQAEWAAWAAHKIAAALFIDATAVHSYSGDAARDAHHMVEQLLIDHDGTDLQTGHHL